MLVIVSKCNSDTLETVQGESYHDEKSFEKQPIEGTIEMFVLEECWYGGPLYLKGD